MRIAGVFAVGIACLGAVVSCGSGDGSELPPDDGSVPQDDAASGDADAPFTLDGGGGSCSTTADCDGGVCVSGVCCSSAASACGGGCCSASAVCLFDKCVTPGGACFTNNDCKPGQYCETALGSGASGDGGVDGGGESGCFEAPPRPGRCLDLPPICADGVDAGADAGGCVPKCEYHPSTGKLNAVAKWTWGPGEKLYPEFIDLWATPTVGRVLDANCDGKINELDPPNVVFVSGNAEGTCCQCNGKTPTSCHTGVLRMLDGRNGAELWALRSASPTSVGFLGSSIALGDVDADKRIDVVAVTGEGYVVVVDATGKVKRTSDKPIAGNADASFGWGGGLAIADMDGDGAPEIAYASTVFTTAGGGLKLLFEHASKDPSEALSTFADVDGAADGHLELVVGNVVYRADGSVLWDRSDLGGAANFPAIGDFDKDGKPDVVLTSNGKVWILSGADGKIELGPAALPGIGNGGPATVADFDGDGKPEIGVAMATYYSVMKPDYVKKTIDVLWQSANHDLSSSVTGSSVFDFEGDGRAEVIYNDECYLHVFDGRTGAERFTGLTTSFTATEASLVADVDGDGHAEMLMISNGADPSSAGWKCDEAPWNKPDPATGRPAWVPPAGAKAYRGLTAFGDVSRSWVGTRTLWSEHTYHVSNICDDRDTACDPPNVYGSIPAREKTNWSVPWLNDFRQNVQDKGIFDAPNATVSLVAQCTTPVTLGVGLRNSGLASLPAGVDVVIYKVDAAGKRTLLGKVTSTHVLFAGQTEELAFTAKAGAASTSDSFVAVVAVDPAAPLFHECKSDDDESAIVKPSCTR